MALLISYLLFSNFELEFNMTAYQAFQRELQHDDLGVYARVKVLDDTLENIRKTVKNITNEQTDEGVHSRNDYK